METGIPALLVVLVIVIIIFAIGRLDKLADELGMRNRVERKDLPGTTHDTDRESTGR